MSSFQIPGLGQAKPNETLPDVPADVVAAAVSAQGHEDVPVTEAQNTTNEDSTIVDATSGDQPRDEQTDVAMVIDRPASPPSITRALEAAIGGQITAQPTAPVAAPLQNDTGSHPEWEIDSSPYESSDSSSSDDSSDEDDSDNEGYELLGVEETARILMEAEGGSDDEGDRSGKTGNAAQLRTKNEVQEDIIPRPDVTITADMKLEELGAIEHLVETVAVVKAITPGEYQVLDTGSVLCTAERVVIGVISETIGKVLQPMYTVRFNSEEELKELGLEVGTKLYYTPAHASFVFTQPLKNLRGTDASNLYDEEVGDEEMEFSDDEKEMEYKRSLKQKKKDKWKNANGKSGNTNDNPTTTQNIGADRGLNYDDDDGPYKPLARPSSMASGPSAGESYEPQPRSFHGGRGRGDFRGRGRGRGGPGRGGRGGHKPRDGYSLPPQTHQPFPTNPPPAAAPSAANFGFQVPGWPQPGTAAALPPPPPPPPGWQPGQQAHQSGAFVNPAFVAALMNQMQAQQGQGSNSGPAWGGQQPPNGA